MKTAEPKPGRYRPRVELIMHDGQGNVLANKVGPGWQFPGGGIDPGSNPITTAKREALEEVGYQIKNPRAFGVEPIKVKWPESFMARAKAKGREDYEGQITHLITAEIGKRDHRLLGSEGDALTNLALVPLSKVIADYEAGLSDPTNKYRVFNESTLPGLKRLQKVLAGTKE